MKRRINKRKRVNKAEELPQGDFIAEVTELLTDGRGLASVDGKTVMLNGALPEERVQFYYNNQKKQFFEGQTKKVLQASPYRVSPKCEVFERCGGCVLQHVDDHRQIDFKHRQLIGNLEKQIDRSIKDIAPPLVSEHWGYRRRARVGLKWQIKKQCVDIGFRGRASATIIPTAKCAILAPQLSELFNPIANMVSTLSLPDSLTHVEMSLGEKNAKRPADNQVALTFRHVAPLSNGDKERLSAFAQQYQLDIYLQSGGDETLAGLNHNNVLSYFLDIKREADPAKTVPLRMNFLPYHFTQVNFSMNRKMVSQALDWLDLKPDDCVLDLFCGLGNFTLPIAQRVRHVVGVEGMKALVDWAKKNAKDNDITNVDFYQADLTQETKMMAWRVKYQYNKILIDPPRAGAEDVMPLIQALKPDSICYVSCHAATLSRDAKVLLKSGYRLEKVGAMDMFPQTAHVEAMALFQKK